MVINFYFKKLIEEIENILSTHNLLLEVIRYFKVSY